jgi:hypothetical protein
MRVAKRGGPIAQREQHAHLMTKRVLPPDQWTDPANAWRATPMMHKSGWVYLTLINETNGLR